ncbi:MAG: hypothetical protein DRP75_04340 [Candidatus Omnitrophota bacterium]|nr:MAG: hypothetical protein DRP75_04340 [Candidatus Omnitrophota bacterium]
MEEEKKLQEDARKGKAIYEMLQTQGWRYIESELTQRYLSAAQKILQNPYQIDQNDVVILKGIEFLFLLIKNDVGFGQRALKQLSKYFEVKADSGEKPPA